MDDSNGHDGSQPADGMDQTGFPGNPWLKDLGKWLSGFDWKDHWPGDGEEYVENRWSQSFMDLIGEPYATTMKLHNKMYLIAKAHQPAFENNFWPMAVTQAPHPSNEMKQLMQELDLSFEEMKQVMRDHNHLEASIFYNSEDNIEHGILTKEGMISLDMISIFPDNLRVDMQNYNTYICGTIATAAAVE
ncbi:unknown protein [Seminavis robusta]|uniref:Uncharacterized protein n=1 Tax=Seminavis robusta TaxID=568900 RepID=A0A9N8HMV7_9STRA|nr:unknown protein [Seminavis robusta]|eukprot:Sro775_g200750.1 n/a (189) ;mRNA; f:5486-6052